MNAGPEQKEARYSLDVIPGTEIARFHWVGPITYKDRKRNARLMSEFCSANDVRRVLIDGRDQESMTDVTESYEFAKDVPVEMAGLLIAVVHRPDDDTLTFIETVAFNRGASTKSFTSVARARAWLESGGS